MSCYYHEAGVEQFNQFLDNDHLQSIRLINDMEFPFPVVELGIYDFGDLVQATYLADGFSTVTISMIPTELFEDRTIDLTFIVDFFEIGGRGRTGAVMIITGVGENKFILNSKLEYSTGSDNLGRPTLKPTTSIIEDVLQSVKLNFNRSKFFRTCDNEIHSDI